LTLIIKLCIKRENLIILLFLS